MACIILNTFLLPNKVTLYGSTTFFSSIHQLMEIWVVSIFWLLWIILWWTFMYRCLCGHVFLLFLDICLAVELLFNVLRNYQIIFHNSCAILHPHQQCVKGPIHTPANTPYDLSFFIAVFYWVCSGVILWFFFVFPWWLLVSRIFSQTFWLFLYLLWRNDCSDPVTI